jgi:hypothetical protein
MADRCGGEVQTSDIELGVLEPEGRDDIRRQVSADGPLPEDAGIHMQKLLHFNLR